MPPAENPQRMIRSYSCRCELRKEPRYFESHKAGGWSRTLFAMPEGTQYMPSKLNQNAKALACTASCACVCTRIVECAPIFFVLHQLFHSFGLDGKGNQEAQGKGEGRKEGSLPSLSPTPFILYHVKTVALRHPAGQKRPQHLFATATTSGNVAAPPPHNASLAVVGGDVFWKQRAMMR